MVKEKILLAAVILLVLVLLVAPRGVFKEKLSFGLDEKGSSAVEVQIDPPFYKREIPALYLLKSEFSRKDYFFVVYYRFYVQNELSLPAASRPVYLVVSLPGSIIESNADKVEKERAYWSLSGTDKKEFVIQTRVVRWWYILPLVLAISYLLWWKFKGEREATLERA